MASAGQFFSPDFFAIISRMQEPEKITDFVLSHLNLSVEQGQKLLEVLIDESISWKSIYQHLMSVNWKLLSLKKVSKIVLENL